MLTDEELQALNEGAGRRLAESRELRGLDQQTLSNMAKIQRVMISYFESGSRPMSSDHLRKLGRALSIRPEWLLTGNGDPTDEGPTLSVIRDEAWIYRNIEVDFISAINSLIRKHRNNKKHMAWAIAGCIKAYWGAHWLGTQDTRDIAKILESIADRFELNIIEILESTAHCNASQYIADCLMHRGIDPEAFVPMQSEAGFSYELKYMHEHARPPERLLIIAQNKGLIPKKPEEKRTPIDIVINYFSQFMRSSKED